MVDKMGKISDEYYIQTGEDTIVTSGTRFPDYQAELMYDNRIRRGYFAYLRSNALIEIEAAFNNNKNKSRAEIIAIMAEIIRKQVANKIYISRHLVGHAADVAFPKQKEVFKIIVNNLGGKVVKEDDHWHLQFN